MFSKQLLLDSCREEIDLIKHLGTKVPKGALDWRPTPGQRSTIELMRYLTAVGLSGATHCVTRNWDHAEAHTAEAEKVTAETFADAMDRQMARIEETLADFDESSAATTEAAKPWGPPTNLASLLIQTTLKPLVAYRMQFFLYAKQSGNPEINSMDCWAGMSSPDHPS